MPTIQHLSYAGITLPLSPSFLEKSWFKVVHDQYQFIYADFWNFDSPGGNALPTPSLPKPPEFKLDVLTWPTGASNPAWFHTVIETNRWNAISAACAPSGFNTPKPLYFYDGRAGKTITAQMYIAGAARPLNQLGNAFSDLWLLTLTDVRFYWYFARGSVTQPSSWTDLYSKLGVLLGTTITPAAVNSAYGTPSSKWVLPYRASTPAILDAAAAQVGQRVVVGLDGTVTTVNWDAARTAALNYINTAPSNTHVISGGLIQESAIAKYVPGYVRTLFLNRSTTPAAQEPHIVSTSLSSLAITEYGSATGITGYHQSLYADLTYTGSNVSSVNNYAVQAARDWYGWRLSDLDIVYAGIEPWVPTGWEDKIEWTLKLIDQNPALPLSEGDDPYTKTQITRDPWTDTTVGDYLQPNTLEGDAPEFKDLCVNGFLVRYTATIYLDAGGLQQTEYVFDQSLGIPCNTDNQRSGSNRAETPYISLEVVTNVCLDSSGGLVVEKRRILVPSNGAISKPGCASVSTRCCPSGSGAETDCCPNGSTPATAIAVAIDGPMAVACGVATASSAAYRVGDVGLEYEVFITTPLGESLFTIYCDGTQWKAIGSLVTSVGVIFFNIELVVLPVTGLIAGTITIPGCGDVVLLATSPCSTESGSQSTGSGGTGSGGTGSGGTVLTACCGFTPIPASLSLSATGALAAIGTVPLTYNPLGTAGAGWYGSVAACGGTISFEFLCTMAGGFNLNAFSSGAAGVFFLVGNPATTCSPFIWNGTYVNGNAGACGAGGGNLNIVGF